MCGVLATRDRQTASSLKGQTSERPPQKASEMRCSGPDRGPPETSLQERAERERPPASVPGDLFQLPRLHATQNALIQPAPEHPPFPQPEGSPQELQAGPVPYPSSPLPPDAGPPPPVFTVIINSGWAASDRSPALLLPFQGGHSSCSQGHCPFLCLGTSPNEEKEKKQKPHP